MDASDLEARLLFAIPKKGRLHDQVMTLLSGADIQFHRKNRLDIALSTNLPIALVFLPAADIAQFVSEGNVDLGITGQDMVAEAGVTNLKELIQLGFGKCKLCVQVPISSEFKSAKDLVGKRIATSFDRLVSKYFQSLELEMNGKATKINSVSGSVEAACALGLADGIVDLVESGETMHAAKLHAIDTVMTTQAVLICNPAKLDTNPLIHKIVRRIEGVIVAQRFLLCTYNVQRNQLSNAIKITPGKKAPTISPLEHDEWVSVSSMVSKSEVVNIMDQLEEIGAQDILITEIKNARLGV
jgi:ATP phosphoribosyltransferase